MRDLDGRLRGLLDSLDAHVYTLVVDGATPRRGPSSWGRGWT